MKKHLRILPVIFLMTMLFACSKDKGTFTPPYLNGAETPPKVDGFTPPYLNGADTPPKSNGSFLPPYSTDTVTTENREF